MIIYIVCDRTGYPIAAFEDHTEARDYAFKHKFWMIELRMIRKPTSV